MIRKIVIFGLIVLAAFIFYKKFIADTLEPFFIRHSNNVDLLQIKTPDFKVNE